MTQTSSPHCRLDTLPLLLLNDDLTRRLNTEKGTWMRPCTSASTKAGMTWMIRRVVGILGMPGFRVRALMGSWCIYSGYPQLELTRTTSTSSYSRVDSAFICENRVHGEGKCLRGYLSALTDWRMSVAAPANFTAINYCNIISHKHNQNENAQ